MFENTPHTDTSKDMEGSGDSEPDGNVFIGELDEKTYGHLERGYAFGGKGLRKWLTIIL